MKNPFAAAISVFTLLFGFSAASLAAQVDYFTPKPQEMRAEIKGGRMTLLGPDGSRKPAADGDYRTTDGRMIKVRNGKVQGELGTRPDQILIGLLLPAVQKVRDAAPAKAPAIGPNSLGGAAPKIQTPNAGQVGK